MVRRLLGAAAPILLLLLIPVSAKATIPGAGAGRMAVNPVTDKIYVASYGGGGVEVIDGATNAVTVLPTGGAYSLDVNPATNRIYTSNNSVGGITVIDGATNAFATFGAGTFWGSVAVNPVTNKIYAVTFGSVLEVDGATNATIELPTQSRPATKYSVAVDPAANRIYIADFYGENITVLDGATDTTTTIAVSGPANVITADPAANKIYLTMYGEADSYSLAVIDAAANSIVTTVSGASLATVNPETNTVYAPNTGTNGSTGVSVLTEKQVQSNPLDVAILPLTANTSTSTAPTFTFQASSNFTPHATVPDNVVFQVDTRQGTWTVATNKGSGSFQGTTSALLPGFHILYAYATDGQQATSTITGAQSSPMVGSIAAYGFLVAPTAP